MVPGLSSIIEYVDVRRHSGAHDNHFQVEALVRCAFDQFIEFSHIAAVMAIVVIRHRFCGYVGFQSVQLIR